MTERGIVFIIEHDSRSADSISTILANNGYKVQWAAAGEDALEAIRIQEPNLVLLDTGLPDVDAFALCEQLKRNNQTRFIPIIFVAAFKDTNARVKGLELGDDLITKPFEEHEVLARVERQVTVSKVRTALRESEAKFRSVMESAIDAIISADHRGNIRSWNRAATALFGFTENEVLGGPIEIIIPERFRTDHLNGVARVSSGGPSHVIGKTVELAAQRKDGSEFPVELSLATWFLNEDRYYTGIIRDISERKQAEQKFRSVTESAIDAIISADHAGKIISWNNAAMRILGYTSEEAIGQCLEIIIPERFHEPHKAGMKRVTEEGKSRVIGKTVELFARTKGGEEIPIELSLSTWTVRADRYYTGIIRDIGDRKRAEEILRMSEQALRTSTEELKKKNEALQHTLNQLHETQNQLIVQEKMASLGKLSAGMAHEMNNPASAAQRSADQMKTMFRKLQDVHVKLGALSLEPEQLQRVKELDELARQRAEKPVHLDALARSDRESEMEAWLELQGIDNSWELAPALVNLDCKENDLRTLADYFEADQFPIIVDWLTCTHTIHTLLSEISLGTLRIAEIVRALKTYTYMDQAPIQNVDIHEGLDNTLIILRNKLKKGITVNRAYANDLSPIQANGGELNQVWTNIIDNAIDAMEGRGTLILRTRNENPWVVVEIEDNGPGIPEDVQSRIFDPFFTTKPQGHGTGLGLNISRNLIVQNHRGKIEMSSERGKTRFTVRLPMR